MRLARGGCVLMGVFLLASCCKTPPSERTTVSKATTGPQTVDGVPVPLPAGLYFRQLSTCGGCPTPGVAVVLGIHGSATEALTASKTIPKETVPLGYPLLVHTDELGVVRTDRGIAVVAAFFEHRAQGEQWVDAQRGPLAQTSIETILDYRAHFERLSGLHPKHPRGSRFVVQIDAQAPVPAYDAASLAALRSEQGGQIKASKLEQLCVVQHGDIFVGAKGAKGMSHYQWAPVVCDGKPAIVEWSHTTIGSTVARRPDGTFWLTKVIDAACDSPTTQSWPYTAKGRQLDAGTPPVFPKGGCGP